MDISEIAQRAHLFNLRLAELKAQIPSPGFAWYPYDSLGTLFNLEEMLTGEWRRLLDLIGDEPVLDLGCADGDVAFFLESLGCRVHAVDFAGTNINELAGVRTVKAALNSAVEIRDMDIDSQFTLNRRYSVVLLLGLLYHLKNPFYVLETLSRHTRYCLLSTRIARFTPDGVTDLRRAPVAYLLDGDEANQDATNYWVFSEAGLKRLASRTNWGICCFGTLGDTESSDPARGERDERAFCLLRSRHVWQMPEWLQGFHAPEGIWRWTERRFSVVFPDTGPRAVLRFNFLLPDVILENLGPVTLSASVDGVSLGPQTCGMTGERLYLARLPERGAGPVRIDFELDKALPPNARDQRELGLIAISAELD